MNAVTARGTGTAAPTGPRTRGGFGAALAVLAATSALLAASSARAAFAYGSPSAAPPARTASASSDLLLVLDADGREYLAQHTLASEGALLVLALPGSADADHVRFAGPERALFDAAHRRGPGRLSLWSGSAFVRYRHRYADAAVTERDGVFSLGVPSVPARLTVEDGRLVHSSITWVLPEGFEFVSLGEVEPARGRWYRDGRSARFEQSGPVPIELTLSYRPVPPEPDPLACLGDHAAGGDACSADRDGDGVPDHRDVCLPVEPLGRSRPSAAPAATDIDAFGCLRSGPAAGGERGPHGSPGTALVLDGVVFPKGRSDLDLNARRQLDRLALALMRFDEGSVHEITAPTGGTGSERGDRQLSTERARAIRHYLMLRGIGPNRLRASGVENAPSAGEAAGAARGEANRHVELRPFGGDTAPSPAAPVQ